MALTNDFWRVHAGWKDAWTHLNRMEAIIIDEPRYASDYAFAKFAEAMARADLDEVIEDLMLYGKFTIDMQSTMMPPNLASMYPDAKRISGYWSESDEEERLLLLLRLGVQMAVAEQFANTSYEVLPQGIKDKMEAIHHA